MGRYNPFNSNSEYLIACVEEIKNIFKIWNTKTLSLHVIYT